MRKWCLQLILGMVLAFPSLASAQTGIRLSSLEVQLWPEYDQPSMLVIYDFTVAPETELPARVQFRIPQESNLIAVASLVNGNLLNAKYEGPEVSEEWQVVTVIVDSATVYRIEYYQPLEFNDAVRRFTYLWPGDLPVLAFSVSVQEPVDLVSFTSEPALTKSQHDDGLVYYDSAAAALDAGEQFTLTLEYQKSSDALTVPLQEIQPSEPVDENAAGRVSLNNYLPYILGGVGVVLILGGLIYYWQSGGKGTGVLRRRRRSQAEHEEGGSDVYCHQCGTRAKPGDRFCRVCGSRLRQEE